MQSSELNSHAGMQYKHTRAYEQPAANVHSQLSIPDIAVVDVKGEANNPH